VSVKEFWKSLLVEDVKLGGLFFNYEYIAKENGSYNGHITYYGTFERYILKKRFCVSHVLRDYRFTCVLSAVKER